jgi:hypothetical protein
MDDFHFLSDLLDLLNNDHPIERKTVSRCGLYFLFPISYYLRNIIYYFIRMSANRRASLQESMNKMGDPYQIYTEVTNTGKNVQGTKN